MTSPDLPAIIARVRDADYESQQDLTDAKVLADECSRLQERVRVLEALLRSTMELAEWMSGSGDFDALGNWAEGRATCNRARAALEGIER